MLPLVVMQFFNYTLEGHPNNEIQHVSRRRPRPLMNANNIEISFELIHVFLDDLFLSLTSRIVEKEKD